MLSFDEIYTGYYDKVRRYLSSIVGPDQCEDLAQEVFIKVNKSLDSLKDEARLSSWIFSIAINTARDRLRSVRSGIRTVSIDGDIKSGKNQAPFAELIADHREKRFDDILIKEEMLQCYADYVKKLPAGYFEVYVLSEFEGLTDAEIAAKLSLKLQTVKMRLHRARAKLSEELRLNCSCYNDREGNLMCEPKNTKKK